MAGRRYAARRRQRLGLVVGGGLGALVVSLLLLPDLEGFHAPGPMNTGHQSVACDDCHLTAPGSLRQQLQANARYLLGRRERPADFGRVDVGNDACLACHQRPNDRHPVFRFVEPRFAEARRAIAPHLCVSCHDEHTGRRITARQGYCVQCHGSLALEVDPIDVPHARLVADARWETCLGCHDFHGNHVMEEPKRLEDAIPPARLAVYFEGGESPYPDERVYRAKTRREEADDG